MISDARTITDGSLLECDVCIVGAGPAGITLALELEQTNLRIVVLAGGDLAPRAEHRTLNEGRITGAAYFPMEDCRIRALGGTTHAWGGWARPMESSDFMPREWVPHSGWPIALLDLASDFEAAYRYCGVGPVACDSSKRARHSAPRLFPLDDSPLREIFFHIAPVRFGERNLPLLCAARDLTVLLNAHALKLVMASDARSVSSISCASQPERRFAIRARTVVLAAGGIENPRLLLASRGQCSKGVGNAHGLVGRYFGDHLHVPIGEIEIADPSVAHFFQPHISANYRVRGGLALTEASRCEHRLLGSAITLHNADDPHDLLSPPRWKGGYESLMLLARSALRGRLPDSPIWHTSRLIRHIDEAIALAYKRIRRPVARRLLIGLRAEQSPCAESRITLATDCDRFGMPMADLHWRISKVDLQSITKTQRLIAASLCHERVYMYPRNGREGWSDKLQPGAHHMGTTRMHAEPTHGVVDADCRVHGTTNLYVTGSSVFPTGGWVPPTLTIVALAVRLARAIRATHSAG